MRRVHTLILGMMQANKDMQRANLSKTHPMLRTRTAQNKMLMPTALAYAQHATARTLKLKTTPTGTHKHHKHDHHLKAIRDFLGHTRWDLTDETAPGITWIDLLAGYEAYGYRLERNHEKTDDAQHGQTNASRKSKVFWKRT